jgi:penicillin-binding protein 1A
MQQKPILNFHYRHFVCHLWLTFVACLIGICLYIGSVKINLGNLYGELPALAILENPKADLASELYASDGVLLGKYFRYNRSPVDYEQVSPHLIHALLATEDYKFENHAGIYLKGLGRAFILSVLFRQDKGGGSTITQQLAKNLFKTRTKQYQGLLSHIPIIRTLVVKTKEWIVAVKLERAYTKKEIIMMYLNTVSFGSNTYGIKVAAQTFFNTSPDQLSIEQAALLIGILRAPTYYSPIKNPERALKRRNVVLAQLFKYHFINQDTYETLRQKPIALNYKVENYNQGLATYFRATIRTFLVDWAKKNGYDLFEDGLKIYTTIDSRVQAHAEKAVQEHMKVLQSKFEQHWEGKNPWVDKYGREIPNFMQKALKKSAIYKKLVKQYGKDKATIDSILHTPVPTELFSWEGKIDTVISPIDAIKYNKRILHTGMMAMDPNSGHIKAWVGGINYQHFSYDHVFQGKRQPGSTFKPIVYVAAIDNGYSPCYEVVDAPTTFKVSGKLTTWTPKNASGIYTGKKMTLRQAMARSVNSITAYLLKQIGPELVIDYARRLGIKSHLDPVPALCLGSSDVSIYELVGAYSTFMNKGVWTEPIYLTRIEDKHGRIIQEFVPQKQEALSEETAWLMLHMLKGTVEENGTLRNLSKAMKENNEVAGKTGTTSNHSDGWCIGMTQGLCTGIWVGGEDRCIHFRTLATGQGAATARPIWEKFMLHLYEDPDVIYKKGPLPQPSIELDLPCIKAKPALEETATRISSPEVALNLDEEPISEVDTLDTKLDVKEIF